MVPFSQRAWWRKNHPWGWSTASQDRIGRSRGFSQCTPRYGSNTGSTTVMCVPLPGELFTIVHPPNRWARW